MTRSITRFYKVKGTRALLSMAVIVGKTSLVAGEMLDKIRAMPSQNPRRLLSEDLSLQFENNKSFHMALKAVFESALVRSQSSPYSIDFKTAIRDPHVLVIAGAMSAVLVMLVGLVFCCFSRRTRVQPERITRLDKGKEKVSSPPTIDLSFSKRRYGESDIKFHTPIHFVRFINRSEILRASDNFSDKKILGKGSFGTVYKGNGPGGSLWAIKRAHRLGKGSTTEFQSEVDVICRVNHRNLTGLLGYCTEAGEKILVYEYVTNGTLRQHLDIDEKICISPLDFKERLDIALGVARGLHYLHTCAKDPMCHRNVKSDKILLDGSKQPKLSDFGLRTLTSDEPASKNEGYMDPDYVQTGVWTVQSDVYRYGVVLFEIITGQQPIVQRGDDRIPLVKWANEKIYAQQMDLLFDPNMESSFSQDFMSRLARLARKCTFRNPPERPAMYEVVHELEDVSAEFTVETEQAAIWDAELPDDSNMTPIPGLSFPWTSPPILGFPGEAPMTSDGSGQNFRWPSPPHLELPKGPASKFPTTTKASTSVTSPFSAD